MACPDHSNYWRMTKPDTCSSTATIWHFKVFEVLNSVCNLSYRYIVWGLTLKTVRIQFFFIGRTPSKVWSNIKLQLFKKHYQKKKTLIESSHQNMCQQPEILLSTVSLSLSPHSFPTPAGQQARWHSPCRHLLLLYCLVQLNISIMLISGLENTTRDHKILTNNSTHHAFVWRLWRKTKEELSNLI